MLHIQSFTFNAFQENTFVVSNDAGDCLIVDPGCHNGEEETILRNYIDSHGLTPKFNLNTHCHIDHVFGNKFVFDTYGLKPMIHPKEQPVLDAVPYVAQMYGLSYNAQPDVLHFHENEIQLGEEKFEILFVPGHAPGHVAFYHRESGTLLSGDVLFKESVGRHDLPGGDANTLFKSIREVLYKLPDETTVYSGHTLPTTIGHEKRYNPFVKGE